MPKIIEGNMSAEGLRLAIVVSRFNDFITNRLVEGAMDVITRSGGDATATPVVKVPGAFELALAAKKLAGSGKHDAVVCLGAVILGGTDHYQYIASEVSKGIAQAAIETGVPCLFGVLTCDTIEQAIERAGTKAGNKGADAAAAALEMVNLLSQLPPAKA